MLKTVSLRILQNKIRKQVTLITLLFEMSYHESFTDIEIDRSWAKKVKCL